MTLCIGRIIQLQFVRLCACFVIRVGHELCDCLRRNLRRNLQLLASSRATCDCCRARSPLHALQANCRQNRSVAEEGGHELCDFACVATCVATRNLRSVATCNAATGGATSVCNKPLTISSFLNLCDTSVILLIKFKSSQFSKSIIFVQMTPVYCGLKIRDVSYRTGDSATRKNAHF